MKLYEIEATLVAIDRAIGHAIAAKLPNDIIQDLMYQMNRINQIKAAEMKEDM